MNSEEPVLLTCLYKPPQMKREIFVNNLIDYLNVLIAEKTPHIIGGDFKVDVLADKKPANFLKNFMAAIGFQLRNSYEPTRKIEKAKKLAYIFFFTNVDATTSVSTSIITDHENVFLKTRQKIGRKLFWVKLI